MTRRTVLPAIGLLLALAALPCVADAGSPTRPALSLRAGIPADTLLNLDMYHIGVALEAGLGWQLNPWLILGGQASYGISFGKVAWAEDYRHQLAAAARVGFGKLGGLSGSVVLGLVYMFPRDESALIPDLGLTVDYRWFSLGLSTGTVSAGVNLRL